MLQPGLCGVPLGLMAIAPLDQELSRHDIHIPSAGWWSLDWCLYHAGGRCQETFELWCSKVKMWDVCMGVEQDPSQNRDEQALASRWDPIRQGTMEGCLAEAPSKHRIPWEDLKVTLGSSSWHCPPAGAETPLSWALGQSLPRVPAALPSLQRLGHQSGKATGAPFPASPAAAHAFPALDPPNYS